MSSAVTNCIASVWKIHVIADALTKNLDFVVSNWEGRESMVVSDVALREGGGCVLWIKFDCGSGVVAGNAGDNVLGSD